MFVCIFRVRTNARTRSYLCLNGSKKLTTERACGIHHSNIQVYQYQNQNQIQIQKILYEMCWTETNAFSTVCFFYYYFFQQHSVAPIANRFDESLRFLPFHLRGYRKAFRFNMKIWTDDKPSRSYQFVNLHNIWPLYAPFPYWDFHRDLVVKHFTRKIKNKVTPPIDCTVTKMRRWNARW